VDIPNVLDATTALSYQLVLVSQVVHVDVHSNVVEHEHTDPREREKIPKVSYATATLSSLVENNDVHKISVELVSSYTCRDVSPVQTDQHVVAHDDVHLSSPAGPLIVWSIHVESFTVINVEGRSNVVATTTVTQAAYSDRLVSTGHEDIHSNWRIQQDMELWRCICEYDKESVKMPFTLVLSKKQKYHLKKMTIGKPAYKIRSRGAPSPTNQ